MGSANGIIPSCYPGPFGRPLRRLTTGVRFDSVGVGAWYLHRQLLVYHLIVPWVVVFSNDERIMGFSVGCPFNAL